MNLPTSYEKSGVVRTPLVWRWPSTGLAVAALIGITLGFYHGLWLPGLVLVKRDAYQFHPAIKQYLIERLSGGELPQWIPYEALGRPFIGTAAAGVFHPFTALYFLLPIHDAYRASTLISCLLAALGAFALGRRLNFSHAGALVSGLAFMLSGYVVSLTNNIQYFYPLCVLPLFCVSLDIALTGSHAWMSVPSLVWASVFLNGDVQTGYHFLFIATLWTATRTAQPSPSRWLRLIVIGVLTALLAGIQLGPSAAVFVDSNRSGSPLFYQEALFWSTHPLRLVTILASPVSGQADPVVVARLFFGSPQYGVWAESLYLGLPVVGLAFLGACDRPDLRSLALLGLLALLLALGRFGGLYEIFYQFVPLWSAFRYPEKLMGVVSFATAMLAGAGFDTLRAGKGSPVFWLLGTILCAGAGLSLYTDAAGVWSAEHFEAPAALAREVTRSTANAFLFSAAAAFGTYLVVALAGKGSFRQEFLLACLVAIIILDLSRANQTAYLTAPAAISAFTPPLAEALRTREGTLSPGRFRLISIRESQFVSPKNVERVLGFHGDTVERRHALDLEHNTQFHIETPHAYLPGYSTALQTILPRKVGIEVAARFNVVYFVGYRFRFQHPQFANALVASLPVYDLVLARNPAPVKPRAYLSKKPERVTTPVDPKALIIRPDFLSGEVDVIETPGPTLPGPAIEGSAVIERYAPEEVRVRVDTPRSAVLILLDAFDKGWTATLDGGAELPILRANALVRAVVVPAGGHVVTFSYQTPLLKAGAWASLAGVLLCLGLLAHARWRTRCQEDRR